MADEIRLANEFGEVVVERVPTRNGARLRISVPASGRSILLCPLELEALTWQHHDLFSRLLQTPHAPALFRQLGQAGIWARRFADHPRWLRFGLPGNAEAAERLRAVLARHHSRETHAM